MNKLILYTTDGCHLCAQAEQLLVAMEAESIRFELESVDISFDETLIDQYGIRIPVVKNAVTEREVAWPFGLQELLGLF